MSSTEFSSFPVRVPPSAAGESAACDEPLVRLARFDAQSAIAYTGRASSLRTLRQESPLRFLRPDAELGDAKPVVIANTAGGVVGGDRLSLAVEASEGAALCVTGQAAEKIYRSRGDEADLALSFSSLSGARLEVVPQGTILFDGARLRRRTQLRADADATLLYGEILHLGRAAMNEHFDSGRCLDRTEIVRSGRLVLTDVLRLEGDLARHRGSPSGFGGARAVGVIHLLHPTPEFFLPELRARIEAAAVPGVRIAAALHEDGPLVVRLLSADGAALRRAYGSIWAHLRRCVLDRPEQMPRIWSI